MSNHKMRLGQPKILRHDNKSAFSLTEVGIALIVLGLLIAAIFAGNALINKARLTSARALTRSAPMTTIDGTALWVEGVMEDAIRIGTNGESPTASGWTDRNIQTSTPKQVTQSNDTFRPTLVSKAIKSLPALVFDGTDDEFTFDGSFLSGNDYTIFFAGKREDTNDNFFLGDNTSNQMTLGWNAAGNIVHSQGGAAPSYNTSLPETSTSTVRVLTFVQNSAVGKKIYVDGSPFATSTDTSKPSGISTLTIGKSFKGTMGELIIYPKALKDDEIKDIHAYLFKKWKGSGSGNAAIPCLVYGTGITGTVTVASGGSATCDAPGYSGTTSAVTCTIAGQPVTANCGSGNCGSGFGWSGAACLAINCAVSGTGISGSPVAFNATSATCGASGYAGTIPLTVGGGDGTCSTYGEIFTNVNCGSGNCASTPSLGYGFNSSNQCTPNCSVTGTGISGTQSVPSGNSASCDVLGYTGNTATITCGTPGGVVSQNCGSGNCATNYGFSGGQCLKQCTISGSNVPSATTVLGGGTFTCSTLGAGYTGSFGYACNTAGGTVSGSCTIASGYRWNGTASVANNCTFSGTIGINNGTAASGAGTKNCNATYFNTSDSVTYACNTDGGTATVTGGACDTCSSGTFNGTTCVQNCNVSGTGIAPGSTVSIGATTAPCNAVGYNNNNSASFTACSAGSPNPITTTCGSGTCHTSRFWDGNASACVKCIPWNGACWVLVSGMSCNQRCQDAGQTGQSTNPSFYNLGIAPALLFGTGVSCKSVGCNYGNVYASFAGCPGYGGCIMPADQNLPMDWGIINAYTFGNSGACPCNL